MSYALRAFGLRLRSDLDLPGAAPDEENSAADVVIEMVFCRANTVRKPQPCNQFAGPYELTPEYLIFTMPGVARYLCRRDGAHIAIEADRNVSPDELAAYLQATALPALLWLRGAIVLHAAVSVPPGTFSAVALAGASGIGKSTLLRSLLDGGARAVGDDSVALSADRKIAGLPGCTMLASYRDSALPDRTSVPVARAQQVSFAPLSTIVELRRNTPAEPQRLKPAEACALFLRNLHRPRVPRLLALDAALLPRIAGLAETIPAWIWSAEDALRCSPGELAARLRELGEHAKPEGPRHPVPGPTAGTPQPPRSAVS